MSLVTPARRRATGFAAAIAVVAALLSPLAFASTAQAAEVVGVTSTPGYSGAWADKTLSNDLTVGTFYTSSVQGPTIWWIDTLGVVVLPAGLAATIDSAGVVTVSGYPSAAGSTNLEINLIGGQGSTFKIVFAGMVVKPALVAAAVTVNAPEFANYNDVELSAIISPSSATGILKFYANGAYLADATVSNGAASAVVQVPASLIATNPVFSATYSGDGSNASSTSTDDPSTYIYGDRVITGSVTSNGAPVSGTMVFAIAEDTPSTYSAATNSAGAYSIQLDPPVTLADATTQYYVQAAASGVYYAIGAGPGVPNATTELDASLVGEAQWKSALPIFNNVAPIWIDQTIAQPRLHVAYNDSLDAAGSNIVFSVVAGALPTWLQLNAMTGALNATDPDDQNTYTFTIAATNGYASLSKQFTISAADAWIAPAFTDSAIATPQEGMLLDDQVLAVGDGPIVYTVTSGALPSWMSLDATTGLIGGTPPLGSAGESYAFTITATGHGTDSVAFSGTVAAPASAEIGIGFAVGDVAAGSTFDFEISGAGDEVPYSVTVNSVPYLAAQGFTSTLGTANGSGTIQAAIDEGAHSMVLLTYASDGTPRSTTVWFTVLANGRIGAISTTGPIAYITIAALASTGVEITVPIAGALLLLMAGAFLRRRRWSQQA